MGKCRSCGAEILWIETPGGKAMPCNPEPVYYAVPEEVIRSLPPADVAAVVRCRNCYFRALDGADVPVCTGAMAYSHTPDDWFCAAGKPKDGEQNE